jgi:hypothetical protein
MKVVHTMDGSKDADCYGQSKPRAGAQQKGEEIGFHR